MGEVTAVASSDRVPDVKRRWLLLLLLILLVLFGVGLGGLPDTREGPSAPNLSVTTPTPTPTPGGGAPTGGDTPTGGDATKTPTAGGEATLTATPNGTASPHEIGTEEPGTSTPSADRERGGGGGGGGGGGAGDAGSEEQANSDVALQIAGSQARITYANAVPGTSDRAELLLTNVGNGSGRLAIANVTVRERENVITEAEAAVDDTPDEGELADHVMVVLEVHDADGTVEYLYGTDAGPRSLASLSDVTHPEDAVLLDPGEEATVVVDWQIPRETGNEIQSDVVAFDLRFGLRAEQT